MKVEGTFLRKKTRAQMTRAALKMWQLVAKYTIKLLLCQGVEDDVAMTNNSRRKSFADANLSATKSEADGREHIAFNDMCKMINTGKKALYTLPTSQKVRVAALANWESAPNFVLDEHLGSGFPKASTDRLLNNCNPFLSGKRRAKSEDLTSEAPTVLTDCSTIPENDVVEESKIVEEEVKDIEEKEPIPLEEKTRDTKVEKVSTESESSVVDLMKPAGVDDAKSEKQTSLWVKCNMAQSPAGSSCQTSWEVRWVLVRYGRYTKYYVNRDTGEKVVA